MFASALVAVFVGLITQQWKDFRAIALAIALTLGCIALSHLVRTPWLFYKSTDATPNAWAGIFGAAVIAGMVIGIVLFGKILWDNNTRWLQDRQSVESLTTERSALVRDLSLERDRNRPKFEITYGTPVIGYTNMLLPDGRREQHVHVFLPVTVLDHGAPSIIRDVELSAKLKDSATIRGENVMPTDIEFADLGVRYDRTQALVLKGRAKAIESGGLCDGFVVFLFPFNMRDTLGHATYTLIVHDIENNAYPVNFTLGNGTSRDIYAPPDMAQPPTQSSR